MRNEVRWLREDKGLSQGQLAGLLGVSRQTVNAIETGRYDPSLPLALRIARLFGFTVEEIFHDDTAPAPRSRSRRAR
jgi:putative transcriptional regulator